MVETKYTVAKITREFILHLCIFSLLETDSHTREEQGYEGRQQESCGAGKKLIYVPENLLKIDYLMSQLIRALPKISIPTHHRIYGINK